MYLQNSPILILDIKWYSLRSVFNLCRSNSWVSWRRKNNVFLTLQNIFYIRFYQIPSCACRFSPSYPPAVHKTDIRHTRDEPANLTNHCKELVNENLSEHLTSEGHFISIWRSSKRSYSSSSSNKSLSSSDCTSSQVFPNSCNTSTKISTKPTHKFKSKCHKKP